jgi:hypothetical protein
MPLLRTHGTVRGLVNNSRRTAGRHKERRRCPSQHDGWGEKTVEQMLPFLRYGRDFCQLNELPGTLDSGRREVQPGRHTVGLLSSVAAITLREVCDRLHRPIRQSLVTERGQKGGWPLPGSLIKQDAVDG